MKRPEILSRLCGKRLSEPGDHLCKVCIKKWNREVDNQRMKERNKKPTPSKKEYKELLMKIYKRDGGICGICGKQVDYYISSPDPLSPTMDHIRPIARGGKHSEKNLQLAHRRCNSKKGAKINFSMFNQEKS